MLKTEPIPDGLVLSIEVIRPDDEGGVYLEVSTNMEHDGADETAEFFDDLIENAPKVRRQRDALYAACKRVMQLKVTAGDDEAFSQLRAAIRLCEGGAQ